VATDIRTLANAIRALTMDAVEAAASGHPGMPMGMADAATVLYTQFLKVDPAKPDWPDRDRLVLSAGHGSMLLYAAHHLLGYAAITLDDIRHFRQLGRVTAGHPEYDTAAGIETTTGPLGQGLATAVGMAMAEARLAAEYGRGLVDHYTYVIAGDGCLMEGVSHEAASLAGHMGLSRLVVLYDDNGISIDGPTSLAFTEDVGGRFSAYGWDVQRVDGHDPEAVAAAIATARETATPSLICCKTTIGFGAPTKGGSAGVHGAPLGTQEIAAARAALDWPHPPFVIPDDILQAWRAAGARHRPARTAWEERYTGSRLEQALTAAPNIAACTATAKAQFCAERPKIATRAASGRVLEHLLPAVPALIGGSADLTGSVNTRVKGMEARHIHWGVREFGMAAAMNGLALHGPFIPYGGTFLVFSDYARPALRLSALMDQRVIYVMTHDSIGLGEDGPTHQPVEHLASLRAMPGMRVLRPCDGVETAECWELALAHQGPSTLSLSRQGLPTLREDSADNLCARGAYVLRETGSEPAVTLFATGSEVAIALQAYEVLASDIAVRLVSVPCAELFWGQDSAYIQSLICTKSVKVAVEAGVRQGWERFIGPHGTFIGMDGFGASAPAGDLYRHFGITAEAVVDAVRMRLAA
jgi:transketolase